MKFSSSKGQRIANHHRKEQGTMRRKDREITDFNVITQIVTQNNSATMSLVDGERPYGVMVNYAPIIGDNSIELVFHGATEGRKIDCIRRNPHACFFINDVASEAVLLKGEKPSERSTTRYRSVVLEGTVSLVDDLAERRRLAEPFLKHFGHGGIEMPSERMLAMTQFFLFKAEIISGKQNLQEM